MTAALCIGAVAYLAAVYLKYGRDYYRAGETEVRLHRDGRETIIPISQVAFASYDGSALGVEPVSYTHLSYIGSYQFGFIRRKDILTLICFYVII